MSRKQNNYNHSIVRKIIKILSSIGKVEYRIGESMVGLYRNNKLFGKIEATAIYLINSLGKLKVDLNKQGDHFLQQARIAYVAARG